MSLVRSSYKKSKGEDEDCDEDGSYSAPPEKKKLKTCAPEAQVTQAPPFVASFQPLPIIYPHYSMPPSSNYRHSSGSPVNKPIPRPPDQKKESSEQFFVSPPSLDVASQAKYGDIYDIPDTVAVAINHTTKHGQQPSRSPKQAIMKSSSNLGHSGAVFCANWTPRTGQLLLTASADGCVKFWDPLRTSTLVGEVRSENRKGVRDAVFSDDGRSVLFGGYGKTLYHVDIETGKLLVNIPQEAQINCVAFFGNELVCGLSSGNVMSFDPRDPYTTSITDPSSIGKTQKDSNGRFVRRIQTNTPVSSLLFFEDLTSHIVTCSDPTDNGAMDYAVVVWNWDTGIPQSTALFSEPYPCFGLRRHPTFSQFAVQCSASYVAVFSSTSPWKRKKKKQFTHHKLNGFPIGFDFSPDGQFLYSGSSAGQIYVYQYSNSKLVSTIPIFDPQDAVIGVTHHPVLKSTLAITSWSGKVVVYQ